MAALLCKPCDLFCQGCSKCIDEGCNCRGKVCDGTCKACHSVCCPANAPSPIFLTFTLVVCGIPAVIALAGLVEGASSGCDQPIVIGLGASIGINALLIAFAVYLFYTFSRPYTGQHGDENVWKRGTHMFCYDPAVLCFFFIYAGAIAIAILGPVWSSRASQLFCHGSLSRSMNTVSGFFWFYILGGVFVISLSWCVEAGRRKHQPIPGIGAAAQQMPRQSAVQRLFFPQSHVVVRVQQPHQPAGGRPGAGNPGNIPVVQAVPVANNYAPPPAPAEPNLQPHPGAYDDQTGAPLGQNVPPAYVNQQQEQHREQSDADKVKAAAGQAAALGAQALKAGGNMLGKFIKK